MMLNTRNALKAITLCALMAASIAVAQPRWAFVDPGEVVSPQQDPVNVNVNTNSVMALFMRLEISDGVATAHDLKLTRIPVGMANFGEDPTKIVFQAYNATDLLVGQTSVADRRMNARDGDTVIRDNRTISIALPLISKPEEVEVTVPEPVVQHRFSVESVVRDYCRDFAADPFCSDDPPRSSPHFELLHIPDP